jgi:adenine-specific DNA-methyltransferase
MNKQNHQFSKETQLWLENSDLQYRKRHGQFMTPKFLRQQLISKLDLKPGLKILDPAVGTGELLLEIKNKQSATELEGWDIDQQILKTAEKNIPEALLYNKSALLVKDKEKYDIIVANPPYFQFNPKPEIRAKFSAVISGRVNIFACFFKLSIQLLKPGGQLAFIVPPSMNNGAYFQALREYITEQSLIEDLTIYSDQHFIDAQTAVQIIVLRKNNKANKLNPQQEQKYVFKYQDQHFSRIIFTENKNLLQRLFAQGKTLYQLGFNVQTGSIVWNQNKDNLRQKASQKTSLLLWSHNIDQQKIKLKDNKPQYIVTDQTMTGPAIICNRIIGGVKQGQLKCALIPEDMNFVAENHTNLITADDPLISFEYLHELLTDKKITEIAQMITGNTQLSRNELLHLIPLPVGNIN